MTKRERSVRQVLNIGEIVDLDGKGTWATVESWDESSDIYWVTDRTGAGHEYVHYESKPFSWNKSGRPYSEKEIARGLDAYAAAQDEYDSLNDPDYVVSDDKE